MTALTIPAFLDGTAACCSPTIDPDLFHLGDDKSRALAKQICAPCPLRPACLDHALTAPELRGTWGGLTAPERYDVLNPDDGAWLDAEGRKRQPCGTYSAVQAHQRYREACETCEAAQRARVLADRLRRLADAHASGGTVAGAAIHRKLGESVCGACRGAVNRQSARAREVRQQRAQAAGQALAA